MRSRPRVIATILTCLTAGHSLPAADLLQSALEGLAQFRADGHPEPLTIDLPPGYHYYPLDLDPKIVGEGLTLRAARQDGGPVVISAGKRIADWKVEEGVWTAQVDLPDVLQFYVNDVPRPRCRLPKEGYWRIEEVGPDRRTSFTWAKDTIPETNDLAHTELVFLHDWSISRVPVKALDHETRTLTTKFPIGPPAPHYAIDHYEQHPRFALEGARDFLSEPGEWHFDRETRTLSYLPLPGETPETVGCIVPHHAAALTLRGAADAPVENLRFEGITFSHAHFQPPERGYAAGQATGHDAWPEKGRRFVDASAQADFCHKVTFENCTFRNSSGAGLWLREGCTDITLHECRFQLLGGNGLMIGEPGNPTHLTKDVTVDNCLIEHCGTRYFGAVGIWVGMAASCTIRDSEIRFLPYTGISLGWRWNPSSSPCREHLVENNHIHHVVLTLSDGGGIYTLGRQPGTVLRNNHIHDVRINAGRAESNGIFMDEGTTDLVVANNHIHDIARSPVRFHKAGRNILRGNKLRPGKGIPPLRFNNTPEKNIVVESPK